MKQLFVPQSTPTTVALNQIDPKNKFYGVLNRGKRNFLRCTADGKRAEEMYLQGFTHDNGHKVIYDRATDLLTPLVEEGNKGWSSGVFEFDTLVELALWLEGKENYEVKPKRSHKKKPREIVARKESNTNFAVQVEESANSSGKFYAIRRGKLTHSHLYLANDGKWKTLGSVNGGSMRDTFYFNSEKEINDAIDRS